MSALLVPFFYELRAQRLKVGPTELLALARAMQHDLHDDRLDGFYYLARSILVHREQDLDPFDQAFSAHFKDKVFAAEQFTKDLLDWLDDPANLREMSEEERALVQALDMDEVRRLFEERMRDQKARHEGGNRFIGTGGTSPFGNNGFNPAGVRVGRGGGRSAMGVADARQFAAYRSDVVLDVRHVEVALRKMRAFLREGAEEELDVEATIDATAKNGGELEVKLRPPRKPNLKVLLLMDVGGSMDPYAQTVSKLFSAAKRASNLREVKSYYFHNCIYGRVYPTAMFEEPVRVPDLFEQLDARWRVIVVGDAAMHPAELLGTSTWDRSLVDKAYGDVTGVGWFQLIHRHWPRSVWINPDPPKYWESGTADVLRNVIPMFHLSVDGLTDAVRALSKGNTTSR